MDLQVFGHQSPDTDSTGSPIVWSWYLNEKKGLPAVPKLLGEPNTEALFVLDRWGFEKPEIINRIIKGDSVVIVDTNNPAELPENINDADIQGIIDHHKLVGGLETSGPIDITIRPLACTATIMFDLMGEDVTDMPDPIKGLALSCILSDTLEFRSPTTTSRDRVVAEQLAKELKIDISNYASELFQAKSDVSDFSDVELLRMDSKKYPIADLSFRVSVLETTEPNMIFRRKKSLIKAMETVCLEDSVDHVLFFVVDILREESTLFVPDENIKKVAEKSFAVNVTDDSVVLPGVVSRKKQIIPNLKL
ncbi:MAG: manganese-dependent inorganic pyrophosphatase [Paracoccaceae bacterium]|nr:manganese-dependent inorganic pyrophosphatase [Paracoccaceae bacterium]MDG1676754.1 manganese-dependent inorganic pyrophosphatase [Paracoccaceae bacterium]MDG2247579.1 manganese-dependent inorganic pyrophosphatase [Paracoccaceae bacterium]